VVTSADGTRINLHVTGSGTPLILLHGLPGLSASWRENGYVQDLASDFRVISIDCRGNCQATSRKTRPAIASSASLRVEAYIGVERDHLPQDTGLIARDLEELRRVDPLAIRAAAIALEFWPIVEPEQLSVPTLLIGGSEDHQVLTALDSLRPRIAQSGIATRVLSGLGHRETFERSDITLPLIRSFLMLD
jgi:pimeloyl-ACP methyl ester carboxylesterase